MREARFEQAHFFGTRLTGADARSVRLEGAIIENSDLTGVDLRGARVEGARFIAVNLTGADMRGAEGVERAVFRHSCGAQIEGLPEGLTLQPCSAEGIRAVVAAVSIDAARLERQRAEMAQARAALQQALAQVEVEADFSRSGHAEMVDALREGWAAAAEALTAAEAELRAGAAASWTFEMRREEIGEPLRIILEQIETGEAPRVLIRPQDAPEPARPPKTPDATQPPDEEDGGRSLEAEKQD
jgi:hypothetical protein